MMICSFKKEKFYNARAAQRGFTLIEMAVSMMIVGIILAAATVPLSIYKKDQAFRSTETNLGMSTTALSDFLSIEGRYPCPARTDLDRNDPNYGRETDCTDTSVAVGACTNGICVEENTRTITDPATGTPITITQRVRIGALPFRVMNLTEDETIDGYNNRYKYVVTEELAVATTFNPARGGIDIINENGQSVVTPAMSAHYIIISGGPDGVGVFSREGAFRACDINQMQTENCNNATAAVYRKAPYSQAAGANYFDDFVSYYSADDIPLWRLSTDPAATRFDIEQIATGGSAQFLPGSTTTPATAFNTSALQIAGSMKASGTATAEGELRVDDVCTNPGSPTAAANCFPSAIVADPASTTLSCPAGEVAREIDTGQMVCAPIDDLSFGCTGATPYVNGVNADGSLRCVGTPVVACAARTVSLCGTDSLSLPAGVNGQQVTVTSTDGYCRRDTYRCQSNNWVSINPVGSCDRYQYNHNYTCGTGYTGVQSRRREFNCTTNLWGSWVTYPGAPSSCVCDINATRNVAVACPAGFSGTGSQLQTRTCAPDGWVNSGAPVMSCSCTPSGPFGTNRTCPNAETGSWVTNRYQYVCSPGRTYQALPDINTCSCDTTRTNVVTTACPAGHTGSIITTYHVTAGCIWGDPDVVNTCVPVPPPVCQWSNNDTTTQIDDTAYSANQKGATGCDCGSSGRCYERVGPGQFKNYNSCVCGGS